MEASSPCSWPAPLHMPMQIPSQAYGSKPEVATSVSLPESFVATELWLYDCTPLFGINGEGVPQWREVARVSLLP